MSRAKASLVMTAVAAAGLALLLGLFPAGPRSSSADADADWRLPRKLREVSGLAASDRQTLLTMDDETAVVYEFDPHSGGIRELVDPGVAGDFEGIDFVAGDTFLTTSDGMLYRILPDGRYERRDTGVGQACEVEGLDHLRGEAGPAFLLLCKTNYEAAHEGFLQVFRYDPASTKSQVHILVPFAELGIEPLNPSGIAVVDGDYLIIAAKQKRLLRLDEDLALVETRKLRGHRQAEGIAVLDGAIYVADEGKKGKGGRIRRLPE